MPLSPKAEIGAGVASVAVLPFFADPVGLAMIAHGAQRLHRAGNAVSSIPMHGYYAPIAYRRNPLPPWAVVALTLFGFAVVGGVVYFAMNVAKAAPAGPPSLPADSTKLPELHPKRPPRPVQEVVYHNIDISGDPSVPGDIHMVLRGTNTELSSHQDLELEPGDVVAFIVPDEFVATQGSTQGYDVILEDPWCTWIGSAIRDTPYEGVTRYRFVVSPDAPRPDKCSVGVSFESVTGAGTFGRFTTVSVL